MRKAKGKDPVYSYTLRTDKPWFYRLLNLETGEAWAFSVRAGKLVLVTEVTFGGPVLLPVRAEGPDGTVGDGAIQIWPGHPQYEQRKAELDKLEVILKKPRRTARKGKGN